MKILSMFVVFMLLLSGAAFAQDTAADLEVTEAEEVEVEEVETEDEEEAETEEETADETFELDGGRQYPLLTRALDRIRLAFTLQEERKLELMDKMQQRREDHYNFLLVKGKTEQAEKFKGRTIGLVKNFDNYRAQKQEVLQRIEQRAEEVRDVAATREDVAERRKAAQESAEGRGQRP